MTTGRERSTATRRDLVAQRIQEIPASGIRRFFDLVSAMDGVISLGVGEPDFTTPWHIREAAIYSLERGQTMYTSNYGLFELRQQISRHLALRYGVEYDPASEILVTVGVSEALDLALRAVLDPGDELLCPDPGYVSYLPCAQLAGAEFVPLPTYREHQFRLQAETLSAAITPRSKGLLLSYPSNPTGAVMTRAAIAPIADLADKHDLAVISDEIYDRLVYGAEHICVAALPGMRERTITLGGFSKAYAMTGWRVGYACAPAPLIEALMKVHQYTTMCAPVMSQAAASEALKAGEADVEEMVAEYDRRRRVMVKGLNDIGLSCFEPKGAFYCFPSVESTGLSDEEFAERLLHEERVVVVPGSAFGACGVGHIRCCYATALDQIEEALTRIGRFVQRLK